MSNIIFENEIGDIGSIPSLDFKGEAIADEPMLYGFSIQEAMKQGGPLTKKALRLLDKYIKKDAPAMAILGYHPVIDTKSVLLMPGQYPCIPGWHCDGVLRAARGDQPDIASVKEPVVHYIISGSSDTYSYQGTEYISSGRVVMPEEEVNKTSVWRSVHSFVEKQDVDTDMTRHGHMYRFTRSCLHRGMPAKKRSWRWFFRLSFYHMPCLNEIRKQVQVYSSTDGGW